MGSAKLATVLAITMIVLMAFTSFGTMAQEFRAAPAPSPSMKSAGMALQVPALLAAIVFCGLPLLRLDLWLFQSSNSLLQFMVSL
ncbi:hypothetical protein Tco_0356128 [Tanacetum coccineum]